MKRTWCIVAAVLLAGCNGDESALYACRRACAVISANGVELVTGRFMLRYDKNDGCVCTTDPPCSNQDAGPR